MTASAASGKRQRLRFLALVASWVTPLLMAALPASYVIGYWGRTGTWWTWPPRSVTIGTDPTLGQGPYMFDMGLLEWLAVWSVAIQLAYLIIGAFLAPTGRRLGELLWTAGGAALTAWLCVLTAWSVAPASLIYGRMTEAIGFIPTHMLPWAASLILALIGIATIQSSIRDANAREHPGRLHLHREWYEDAATDDEDKDKHDIANDDAR